MKGNNGACDVNQMDFCNYLFKDQVFNNQYLSKEMDYTETEVF
jgi:hypothetical protein